MIENRRNSGADSEPNPLITLPPEPAGIGIRSAMCEHFLCHVPETQNAPLEAANGGNRQVRRSHEGEIFKSKE